MDTKINKQFPEDHSFKAKDTPEFEGEFSEKFELRYDDKWATKTCRRYEVLFPQLQNRERLYSFILFSLNRI